jgi:hypothetical protein
MHEKGVNKDFNKSQRPDSDDWNFIKRPSGRPRKNPKSVGENVRGRGAIIAASPL